MEGEKVKVLTAGGAASGKKKKSKSKTRNRKIDEQDPAKEPASSNTAGTSNPKDTAAAQVVGLQNHAAPPAAQFAMELEESERENDDAFLGRDSTNDFSPSKQAALEDSMMDQTVEPVKIEALIQEPPPTKSTELFWLFLCFIGIMASFVVYGVLLEYTTSGGRKLHELSFLFVTSALYTITAAAGRYVRAETPTTIPPARFAVLGLTSMGSTFCSVRSLRYVIYPIQVLAKSCKPVPVMLIGALMGKRYDLRKYINVAMIVSGVALFMGGGDKKGKSGGGHEEEKTASSQLIGIVLLFISLCFDGGTGAYEDKLMSVHSVQPFDLMYNIQLGKTILAGVSLLVLNQVHVFVQMCADMGFLLVALGLSGALGQVFIFVTISKFGALTCSIIGLARKITTLVFSIWYFGHYLNGVQVLGLIVCVGSMVMNFMGKSKKGGGHGHGHGSEPPPPKQDRLPEDMQKMLSEYQDEPEGGDVELATTTQK